VSTGNPTVHHEESDVNVPAVFGFAAGLFVVAAIVHVLVWLLFMYFAGQQTASGALPYPLAAGQEDRLPPEPRLQTTPREDLREMRAEEDAVLNGYQWVNRNAGIVRIPIAEAMRLTLERGLPSRQKEENRGGQK